MLHGARVSLAVGLLAAVVAGSIGLVVGGTAALAGGAVDAALMRATTDAMLAVPRLLLLMIAGAMLSPSVLLLVVGRRVGLDGDRTRRPRRDPDIRVNARSSKRRAPPAPRCRVLLTRHLLANAAGPLLVRHHPRRRPQHPARVDPQLLRRRRAAASRQLGQYALPGANDAEHRTVAGILPRSFIFATTLSVNALGDRFADSQRSV